MFDVKVWRKFAEELNRCSIGIVYSPLPDEVDPLDVPFLSLTGFTMLTVPKSSSISPGECAKRFVNLVGGGKTFVIVPGRRFDSKGTRQGRGGGWYDGFLAVLPRDWLRIGVAARGCFSPVPILTREWDEPVDWVVGRDGGGWFIRETFARNK